MVQEGCIKVGAVSFLNTKPLIQPILDNQVFNIDLTLDVPSKIADELRVGALDVALIPIIEYFRCSDYLILPEISISSRGAVKSIRIFSRKPISECQTIALDTSSRTSRVLTQIVLAEKYNVYPSFVDCPPTVNLESVETDAVLLIGDSALRNIGSTEFEVDLGAVWHDLFELPFVYACWVTRYNTDLGDLPQLLNTTLETIPSYNSYLSAPSDLKKEWANRLGPRKKFRLGIVWAGSPTHKNDRNRCIDAFLFQPLTKIRGVSVYSLQVGRNGEAAKIFGDTVTDVAPFLNDFADTAAAVSNLDLVVSVDTSVAHIAGALGWPIWTLIPFVPDWRWLLERDDSPWYPTMQLFRQSERNDWKTVIERLRTELIKTVKLSRH